MGGSSTAHCFSFMTVDPGGDGRCLLVFVYVRPLNR